MDLRKPSVQLAGITNLSLLAVVKPGFVEHSFQRVTHARRLEKVLQALNALRLGQREALREQGVLPDLIGRLKIVHEFRFTLLRPEPGKPQLFLLSVTFDGGWEPYMRFIWRDLGTLLDLMFCHCEAYPLAAENTYAKYIEWVREHEIAGSLNGEGRTFYFADAPVTVGDHRLLDSGRPTENSGPTPQERAMGALRPIAVLYALTPLFTGTDAKILLRAAHDIVVGIRDDDLMRLVLPAGSPPRAAYRAELEWFEADRLPGRPAPASRGAPNPADLQSGILEPYAGVNHGALVMLRVTDRAKAIQTLRQLAELEPAWAGGDKSAGPVYWNVAFTFAGLQALGEPEHQLARFPQEFIQGMELRSGILGDVRGNHPNHWRRPKRYTAGGLEPAAAPYRIELTMVHVVVQWRGRFENEDLEADGVHCGLAAAQNGLLQDGGLEILARQPMRRWTPQPTQRGTTADPIDHLGFADGLSQPVIETTTPSAKAEHWSDVVKPGEIFLGFVNDRGDGPYPPDSDELLDHGSFLVVRKLRQHVAAVNSQIEAQAGPAGVTPDALLEAMVGRKMSGIALASATGAGGANDFNFASDADGHVCPLQSHARRANPRDGSQLLPKPGLHPVPRILRRGMSYGTRFEDKPSDDEDRGVVFMAYAASIAEQFEVIQRWIAGGNSTGLVSTDADPLLGVPQAGRPRRFTCHLAGQDRHIDLGEQPFVTLQWGLYLFTPSLPALKRIGKLGQTQPSAAQNDTGLPWDERLESIDPLVRSAAWAQVRGEPGGVLATDYGVLVGSPEAVRDVFAARGDPVSVSGYGGRMRASVGLTHLGMDAAEHAEIGPEINKAIETLKEDEAFRATHVLATALLTARLRPDPALPKLKSCTLDYARFIDDVLGALCTQWFGLPDGKHIAQGSWHPDTKDTPRSPQSPYTPRCPGDVLSASRYVFGPAPSKDVKAYGASHGQGLLEAAKAYLREHKHFKAPMASRIEDAVRASRSATQPGLEDEVARNVIGVIFGFTPTVFGNARSTLGLWLRGTDFWEIQLAVAARQADPEQSAAFVRDRLVQAMMQSPVPDMLWRTATCNHALAGKSILADDKVVVGVLSASQAELKAGQPDPYLMFGGKRGGPDANLHACPGYGMAMGVLTGLMLALLEAGTVRRTASPTTVTLERETA